MSLKNKKIVVCVCGSVAAIESPKLVRELRRRGADVFCVMSENAHNIIHPYVLEWASENKVVTEITGAVEHVKLCGEHEKKADLMIIAPSTANTIGKIAYGVDDTAVTTFATTAFGSGMPIIIVPAMHISMYNHPILIENIKKLTRLGVDFIDPRIEENKAKFPDIKKIADYAEQKLSNKDLKGKKILVTAGATIEDIDAARFISNKSSGKMGIAIANESFRRGADVTLIRGSTTVEPKYPYRDLRIKSGDEMFEEIKKNIGADVIIHTAAVSDFKVDKIEGKIRSGKNISLNLETTTKIIDQIKKMNKNVFLVGFKAVYKLSKNDIIDAAYKKLKQCNADIIVANDISRDDIGFGSDNNEVFVVDRKKKVKHLKLAHKSIIANQLLDEIKCAQ